MVVYLVSYKTKDDDVGKVKKTLIPFSMLQVILGLKSKYQVLRYEKVNVEDFLKCHPEILYDERAINELAKDFPEIWNVVNSLINIEDMVNFNNTEVKKYGKEHNEFNK